MKSQRKEQLKQLHEKSIKNRIENDDRESERR